MRRITSRFVMLIATAAVAPLLVYGAVSIGRLQAGIEDSVREGNSRVAEQVARQLWLYVDTNARIVRSLGEELTGTNLASWQQDRILENHVLEFPEFQEISLFDGRGQPIASSRFGPATSRVPSDGAILRDGVKVSKIMEDDDNLPVMDLALQLGSDRRSGWIVARISLEELWRFVDGVRVGHEGYALVLSEDMRLVAHGDPNQKRLVVLDPEPQRQLAEVELLARTDPAEPTFAARYSDDDGREKLATGARVADLKWTVMVEQPVTEAYAVTTALRRQLYIAIALALLVTLIVGWLWARSFITRIFALQRATQALAEGRMDQRVSLGGRDEIRQLGDAFNTMAERLVELQEDARKQERQVMFGRIAAGLVHDLSHPIQTIGNSCKLIVRMFDDAGYREMFRQTVDRELAIVRNTLDGLLNIARPKPLERFPVDVNRSIAEAVSSLQQHAEAAGVTLSAALIPERPCIEADLFALGRVYRNLIINAIQATPRGGSIIIESEADQDRVRIRVTDTGCGIPVERLNAIFEDFMTTKRRGLGLGLAISRKIVEQLDGSITVTSEVGNGTTFVLDFPRSREQSMLAAG